jgi:hypothetical protein
VDNDNAVIYELDTAGTLLRSIATTGFSDPEGIAYQGDDYFLLAEEGLATIVRVKLPRSGAGPVAKPAGASLALGANMANSGIEGVACRSSDKAAFAVKETGPPRLYRLALDAAGVPTGSTPNAPFDIEGKAGDAADIVALDDGNFILVNQEGDKLEGYGPQGQALSSLTLGMSKAEGLAVDPATGTLYVVGEPLEFRVFKRAGTAGRKPADANGFSAALASGQSASVPTLRVTLPVRSRVRIDFATPSGVWTRVFQARLDAGSHALALPGAEPAGVGFYRISAGTFQRVFMRVSPP